MEILDLYDREGKRKGITVFRGEYIHNDDFILISHIIIYNSKGEFLVQKRSRSKKINSGKWDVTGGAVKSGESSMEAALRETFEEIGLRIPMENLELAGRHFSRKHIIDIYFLEMEVDIDECVLQKEEVSEIRFVSSYELLDIPPSFPLLNC